ncbi:MAG: lysine exporter LysO family protein [Candidatus Bathyarchaeia archaeon]
MMKYILAVLVIGGFAGYLSGFSGLSPFKIFVSDYVFNFSLVFLLFLMGLAFGGDEEATAKMKKIGARVLILPLSAALGTLTGGFLGGIILNVNVYASMGACAGFGWYTLAGPLAGQLFGMEWGALGFMVNLLRELITVVTTPFARKIGRNVPIAMGGATTMDTTLPIIVHYCGRETLIPAFTSGFILTITAPLTITIIATLAS